MGKFDYDLIVIGGGSGGVGAARRAAEYGAKVAVCELWEYGGTCVHRGCVPKKLLVYSAHYGEDLDMAAGYGWNDVEASFSWPDLVAAKDTELKRLEGFYTKMLDDSSIVRLEGYATFLDDHTVEVGGQKASAERLLIAVGSRPFKPSFPGSELAITSREAFHLKELPERVLVVGSGYIGVEFSGIFNGLGADTHLMFRSPLVLPKFDQDLRQTLQQEMEHRGVSFHPGSRIDSIEKTDQGLKVQAGELTLEVDCVMLATGRVPNTENLGLEKAGVALTENGAVKVDDHLRTLVPHIYALGDCIDRVQLTPVAIAEGRTLAESLYNNNPGRVSYENIATAVFSIPPVGTVGLTQEQAVEKCRAGVDIYRARFRPMRYTLPGVETKALLKMIVDKESDKVVGIHMVGDGSPELIQALAVCVVAGVTKAQFDRTMAVHPSSAEEFVLMRKPSETLTPQGVT